MTARILFFGLTADIADEREIEVSLSNGSTAKSVLETIRQRIPGLDAHKLHISLNRQFATGEEIVKDGDELAIFAAVSGG